MLLRSQDHARISPFETNVNHPSVSAAVIGRRRQAWYSRNLFNRVNWDGETFRYAENPNNWIKKK
jgi:hypothetical protein